MFDVLAVGELNVDIILSGLKRPPVMGEEVLSETYTECMGSSTAICACAMASLGMHTTFFGKLGMDNHGELVMKSLGRYGIDTTHVLRAPEYTTGVTVSMSMPGDRAMVTYFGDTIDAFTAEEVPLEKIQARHIHVGSFFLQAKLRPGLKELFRRAHAQGMTTSLDAGWDDTGSWREALGDVLSETDFFFPNEKEAECIAGTADMEEAARIIAGMGCNTIVKWGSKGSLYCSKDGKEAYRCGSFKVTPVDTTGAGDSFNAGFLTAFLQGKSIPECMRYGNATGAVSVCYEGGATHCPTAEDVAQMLQGKQREL